MLRENPNTCQICVRLGKRECGYHRFKQEYLSKISVSSEKDDHFAQTRSSLNRIHPSPPRSNRPLLTATQPQPFTPQKQKNQHITIEYSNGSRQNGHGMQYGHMGISPQVVQPLRQIQQLDSSLNSYSRAMPEVSGEGSQLIYYPIYPVYQVVYEPVVTNSSYISTPSRIIYQ